MRVDRRTMLRSTAFGAAGFTLLAAGTKWGTRVTVGHPLETFPQHLRVKTKGPIKIDSIEVLQVDEAFLVRCRSSEGATGIVEASSRLRYLLPILRELVIPSFVGKDARDVEALTDDVYRSNYKYAGMPFWLCVGAVELSLLDLLGKLENKPAAALFGDIRRSEIPVYASNFKRTLTAEETVERIQSEIEGTGVKALKLKVGGRMSRNADSIPGRTEALIPLARKTFGDDMTLYVDSNGSYDAEKGIEVGHILEANGYAMYEEPCPWQDYESTKRVADALQMPVSGGEQDSSLHQFEQMVKRRIVDVVQPDFWYNGGFIRCLKVAQMAHTANLQITPHSPQWGPGCAVKFQFAAIVPNAGEYQEHRADQPPIDWCEPNFALKNGVVAVPTGPGWGVTIDPSLMNRAKVIISS